MAESKQRREYGSGSVSQRADGTWTARMVIGVNEKGRPRIKALYGKTEREVKKKLRDSKKNSTRTTSPSFTAVRLRTICVLGCTKTSRTF